MLENKYALLRHHIIKFAPGFGTVTYDLVFNKPYLIVGFHCPEVIPEHEQKFSTKNLMPYELCVNRFSGSDFIYDVGQFGVVGKRTVYNLDLIEANSVSDGSDVIVIVSFLEFLEK